MSIRSHAQLEIAQDKLGILNDAYRRLGEHSGGDRLVDEMARQSLESQIRQLNQEIASFQKSSGRYPAVA